MTKTLTEQWREGTLPDGCYYVRFFTTKQTHIEICGSEFLGNLAEFNGTDRAEVLAPVPSYQQLYGPNDGNIPVGLFTVLKIIKRDIEQYQKIRPLTDLECGIKSQVVSLLKKWGVK